MDLMNYATGEYIRPATVTECLASADAADSDGGAGVIVVDGVRCYVVGEPAPVAVAGSVVREYPPQGDDGEDMAPRAAESYALVAVTIDGRTERVCCVIRDSGDVSWSDSTDWDPIATHEEPAVAEALSQAGHRLWREVQALRGE